MKKLFLILFCAMLSIAAFSQVDGGNGGKLPTGSPVPKSKTVNLWDVKMYNTYENNQILTVGTVNGKKQIIPIDRVLPYAEVYVNVADRDTVTITGGVPDSIADATLGNSSGFSFDGEVLTYTGTHTIIAKISYVVTQRGATNTHTVTSAVYLNDVAEAGSVASAYIAAGANAETYGWTYTTELATNDELRFFLDASSDGAIWIDGFRMIVETFELVD